jgi:hypothetical protein
LLAGRSGVRPVSNLALLYRRSQTAWLPRDLGTMTERIFMDTATTVSAARRALGPVGAYLPASFTAALDIGRQRQAARRLEQAGFGAAWVNEGIGGKDVLAQLGILMASTGRLAFGTGIANIWARAPQTLHGGAALLAAAYSERLVVGRCPEAARSFVVVAELSLILAGVGNWRRQQ